MPALQYALLNAGSAALAGIGPDIQTYPPDSRGRLLARVNGLLGGVLGDESFVLSQSYCFEGLVDRPAEVIVNRGHRIDLLNRLDALALYQRGSPEPPKPKRPPGPALWGPSVAT